jgi:hypothetical protein
MRKLVSVAIFVIAFAVAAPLARAHGDDPSHTHNPITQQQAREFAKLVVDAMLREKAVGESWSKATVASADKKKRGRKTEWVVVFNNPAESDPAKRKLYVFLDLEGEYVAANHSGR